MLNLISNDRVTKAYGDRNDGIYVYKGDCRIGFITDLKAKLLKELKDQTGDSGFRARAKKKDERLGANSFGPRGYNRY